MLVLSRQRDESIIIGDNIVITIVDIRGDKVRLGFKAPTEIPIDRSEVRESKRLGVTGCPKELLHHPSTEYADADSSHARAY